MPRILISWIAKKNDFIIDREEKITEFNDKGAHGQLYESQVFLDKGDHTTARHYVAFQPEDAAYVNEYMIPALKKMVSEDSYIVPLEQPKIADPEDDEVISNTLISLYKQAVEHTAKRFDLEPEGIDVNVFVSPGFPIMQTTWSILAAAGALNARLWRQTPKRHANDRPLRELVREVSTKTPTGVGPNAHFSSLTEWTLSDTDREIIEDYVEGSEAFLLVGEKGTGKTVLAKEIHEQSGRKGEFRTVSFASRPRELIRSDLYGHKKGAFTGAERDKKGVMEVCDGGTVFFDEIHQADLEVQGLLVSDFSNPSAPTKFSRVGDEETMTKDVRIIFGTNENLEELSKRDNFRHDLCDRISMGTIIETKRIDISKLSDRELRRVLVLIWDYCAKHRGARACPKFDDDALKVVRGFGESTARTLAKFCNKILGKKNVPREVDKAAATQAFERATRGVGFTLPSDTAAENNNDDTGSDPWASALNGLLSINNRQQLLKAIHERLSNIKPGYKSTYDELLKKPEYEKIKTHLKGHDVPVSSKRLGEALKKDGIIQ